jgi:hypothetical protein
MIVIIKNNISSENFDKWPVSQSFYRDSDTVVNQSRHNTRMLTTVVSCLPACLILPSYHSSMYSALQPAWCFRGILYKFSRTSVVLVQFRIVFKVWTLFIKYDSCPSHLIDVVHFGFRLAQFLAFICRYLASTL